MKPGRLAQGSITEKYYSLQSPCCDRDGREYVPLSQEALGVKENAEIVVV